jgi:chitinase
MNRRRFVLILPILLSVHFFQCRGSCGTIPRAKSDNARLLAGGASSNMWVTAYYGYWWQYSLPPWKLPWGSMTHIVHFVGGTNTSGTFPYFGLPHELEVGADGGHYQDSLIAIAHRHGVKVLLDLGYNTNRGFDQLCMLGDTAIQRWAQTVKTYMVSKQYDGCDLDFEPRPGPSQAMDWGQMLHYLHDTLTTLNPPGLITCSVMAYYSDTFNPDSLAALCDQVNLMEYDQAGNWENGAGHNSPLYKNPDVAGWDDSSSVMAWLENNGTIPASKLGLGVALYGRIFLGISQPNQRPNDNYQYRWYDDIVNKDIPSAGAKVVWDSISQVPYVSDPSQNHWVTFDDTTSLGLKIAFARRHGLGGIMTFGPGEGYLYHPPAGRDPNELSNAVGRAAGLTR